MKKSLLSIGLLAMALSAKGQFLTYVGDGGLVTVQQDALVYSGGGIQVTTNGLVDNSGNVMMVGGQFATGNANGGNFILRLTDKANYQTYGQFYLTGDNGAPIAQSAITGIVDKEYLDVPHGAYQQVALPFYNKTFTSLNTELNAGFVDNRWTQTEVLSFDNANVISDNFPLSATTISGGASTATYGGKVYGSSSYQNKATSYYQLGTKNWKANLPTSGAGTVYTVKGVPFADGISETLSGAGAGVTFNADGSNLNVYREKYNTYVQTYDPFTTPAWTGNYGKNFYNFGNPFLTNLDLNNVIKDNSLSNLIGIRYGVSSVVWNGSTGSSASTIDNKYVSFTPGRTTPIGDPLPVIKPMGIFELKFAADNNGSINFDNLRRFKNTLRAATTTYDVTAAKMTSTASFGRTAANKSVSSVSKTSSEGVMQIGLVALNAAGEEIGRTYYAVFPLAITGASTTQTSQVRAGNKNIIGTFEEAKAGGIDKSVAESYWLYINVANSSDFKNKEVPVKIASDDVAKIKIELKENGADVTNNVSGDSFYIKDGSSVKSVKNGDLLALSSKDFFVSYGAPNSSTLATTESFVKPSESVVVYDDAIAKHRIIFDQAWKTADIAVYDMSGKLIQSANKVNAQNSYEIALPNVPGVYVVTAVSESGQKFVQKIKK